MITEISRMKSATFASRSIFIKNHDSTVKLTYFSFFKMCKEYLRKLL